MLKIGIPGIMTVSVALATNALAQRAMTPPDFGMEPGTYLQMPAPIPQGGCVWNNAVFSDGAIVQKYEQPRAFFRCIQGSWQSFDSFDAAASGHKPNSRPAAQRSELQPP